MRRERFEVVLEVEPGRIPGVVDIRRMLKGMLRSYSIRCVACRRLPASEPAPGRSAGSTHGKAATIGKVRGK